MKYWLISYSENHGLVQNRVISETPAEWLYRENRWGNGGKVVILHFAMEITEDDYDKLGRVI
jgi:hypothetical protein